MSAADSRGRALIALGSLMVLVWSVPGILIHPDFAVGDDATSKVVLGSDMNGWHAVSGFAVAIPALLLLPRPPLAARFTVLAATGLVITGIWALFSTRVAGGLFAFPNNEVDAALHFVTAAIWLAGATLILRAERAGLVRS